jgi:hypothetical protein
VIVATAVRMRGVDGRQIVEDVVEQVTVPGARASGWVAHD